MVRKILSAAGLFAALSALSFPQEPPASWVDKDTGHRVIRLTDEPGSSGLYFNVNAFTPDGREMIYSAPDGIHSLNLSSLKTRLIVPNPPAPPGSVPGTPASYRFGMRVIVVGSKTNSVFFSRTDPATSLSTVYKADVNSGEVTKLVTLPPRSSVATINADETIGVGTYEENATPAT